MDWWTLIAYAVGVLFNIGIVAKVRTKAHDSGRNWLASGKGAVVVVWVVCFAELLVVGKFDAFSNSQAFIDLLQQATNLAVATVGTHTAAKTIL